MLMLILVQVYYDWILQTCILYVHWWAEKTRLCVVWKLQVICQKKPHLLETPCKRDIFSHGNTIQSQWTVHLQHWLKVASYALNEILGTLQRAIKCFSKASVARHMNTCHADNNSSESTPHSHIKAHCCEWDLRLNVSFTLYKLFIIRPLCIVKIRQVVIFQACRWICHCKAVCGIICSGEWVIYTQYGELFIINMHRVCYIPGIQRLFSSIQYTSCVAQGDNLVPRAWIDYFSVWSHVFYTNEYQCRYIILRLGE